MYKYVATCLLGTETLLANEIKSFGLAQVNKVSGAVEFFGDLEIAYKVCLWSHIASRVLLYITEFDCDDADALYANALDITWTDFLSVDDNFQIKGTVSSGVSINSQYALLRLKDGIADWFQANYSKRPSVAKHNADHFFHFHINKNKRCALYLDLTGEPLHKRAYRSSATEAPLKENLASAILQYSGWLGLENNKLLVDPMCGSGTLLIEAALMSANIAPGGLREHYALQNWAGHNSGLWSRLRQEADISRYHDLDSVRARFYGFDSSNEAISAAKVNAIKAGVEQLVHFEQRNLHHFSLPADNKLEKPSAYLITNPPYGERLGEANQLKYLYKCIGYVVKENCQGWNVSVFSNNNELLDQLNLAETKRLKLFNGPLKCQLIILNNNGDQACNKSQQNLINFENPQGAVDSLEGEIAVDFANRLVKNYKTLKKWIVQNNISCYRLYDRDIPEYNVLLDIYGDKIHLQEYKPPKTIDSERARKRLKLVIETLINVFGIKRNNIYLKLRQRQKGREQYKQLNDRKQYIDITENDLRFLVNFTDYLDTGIFLDHRYIRNHIKSIAKGKDFLNLFSYTGTASIYAASGGAKSTTSVDLSKTYTDWAIKNLYLNGFNSDDHQVIQADCMSWLEIEKNKKKKFDLIFVDPPTFSNSKKLSKDFNIQENHFELLMSCRACLTEKGSIIFSNNFKGFLLTSKLSNFFDIENISELSISRDFNRNKRSAKKIHQSWILKLK